MSLEINGQTGKVTLALNSTFDVIAKADAIPLANGYDAALAWIEFGNTGLTFISSATAWPDCDTDIEFSATTATGASRGCLTGVLPGNQFGSMHKGDLYSFTLTCSSSHTINQVDLVPANQPPADTSGAQFREYSTNNEIIPAVSGIEVNCGPKPTPTPTPGPAFDGEMSLEINGQSGGKVGIPTNSTFDVISMADEIPPNGYYVAESKIDFGLDLTFKDTVALWPDCNAAEISGSSETDAFHGCLNGLFPADQFGSMHIGPLYSFTLTCSSSSSTTQIDLIVSESKSSRYFEYSTNVVYLPAVSGIQVNCVEPLAEPGDTDGDGCSDQKELGANEMLGGGRDFTNPNDYYDINGDLIIDLSNDIFGVIQHYAPTGTEPTYDVNFDRGPQNGQNVWNMTAPDGVIDLTNDILGVIQQYFHSCQ